MRKKPGQRGISLIEILLATGLISALMMVTITVFSNKTVFFKRLSVRQNVMMQSRTCMDALQRILRNGQASTLVISTPATNPAVPNSRVDFALKSALPNGTTGYAIYLEDGNVYTLEFPPGTSPNRIASNVSALMFTGSYQDPAILNVSLRIDAPLDATGTRTSTLIIPNQVVRLAESM